MTHRLRIDEFSSYHITLSPFICQASNIYTINDNYFDAPLTKGGAYILGLIISDGHLNYERGQFSYVCSKKDESLIEFIKEELRSSHPIKTIVVNNREYSKYSISNKTLVQSIINKYDLPHSNKSMNNITIPYIDIHLVSHFLCGFFDGDGSIWFAGETFRAGFSGGEKMMKSIQSILLSLSINSYLSYRYSVNNKNSCQLTINGTRNVKKLGDYLYEDTKYYLLRKRKLFDDCTCRSMKLFSVNGTEDKIKQLYLGGISQSDIAKMLKINYSSTRACIRRLRRKNIV